MEVLILDAMRTCKKRIEDKALRARCISRVNRIREIIDNYQRTLDAHDLSFDGGRLADSGYTVIIGGTDEE